MSLEKLRQQCKWFLENTGHKGFPYLRSYLQGPIKEALKEHTQQEVESVINQVIEAVARELDLDSWIT